MNLESEFKEAAWAAHDKERRRKGERPVRCLHFFATMCRVKVALRFDALPGIPDTDSAQPIST